MSITVHLADLIGSKVIGADGAKHGKVVDVVVSRDGNHRITQLVVGAGGWIERLNMADAVGTHDPGSRRNRIDVQQIDRFENGQVYLKPDVR